MTTHGNAETLLCESYDVSIESTDPALAVRACKTLERSKTQFENCHLKAPETFQLRMVIDADSDKMPCLALFHCDDNLIKILPPSSLRELLDVENAFYYVPPTELFESLVVHEFTHALVYESKGGPGRTFAEDEYIAYALQLASMSPNSRMSLLGRRHENLVEMPLQN